MWSLDTYCAYIVGSSQRETVNNNNYNDAAAATTTTDISIQFLFICVPTQQPKGQLRSEHEWKKVNKHTQSTTRQNNNNNNNNSLLIHMLNSTANYQLQSQDKFCFISMLTQQP
jgi:hypothetical protein